MNISKIIVATLLITSTTAFAEGGKGKMLAKAKSIAAENIDAKIGLLNDLKSCINSANDRAALKACRKEAKTKRQALKESNQARRKEMKAERQKRKEERQKNK